MVKLHFILVLVLCAGLSKPGIAAVGDPRARSLRALPAEAANVVESFGVNIGFNEFRPGELKLLSEAGFRWVRTDFVWAVTEPVKGQYDFAAYDRLMSGLAQYGLRALFILDYANPVYGNAPPRTAETRQAFARWAVAAAKHFGGRGVIWETYNEPNIAQFWQPRPSAGEYAALALAVAQAFRETVPAEKLVGPATSGIDFEFLETCFKAGLLDYWWAVSVHPYRRSDPESVAGDYRRLQELISKYAPRSSSTGRDRPGTIAGKGAATQPRKQIAILSSEWGYSSAWNGLGDERQGQLLARSWLTNAANKIGLSIWYDWHDDGLDPKEPEHHFGTVHHSYHQGSASVFDTKPAYAAVKTLTKVFNGCRFEEQLDVGSADDYVLAFRKAGALRIAAWTPDLRPARL